MQVNEPALQPTSSIDDKPKEACGVFGVFAPGESVAPLVFDGLYALQHRGQESAGMAVSDGEMITVVKDMGLVTQVFNERNIAALWGFLGIGHTRYSTTGSSAWHNAQPVYRSVGAAGFALGHNGNLTNTEKLANELGMLPGSATSDSDLVAELVSNAHSDQNDEDSINLAAALEKVLPQLEGAFSFVLMDSQTLIGVRDPNGFRPLCLGKLETGWVLASETPALDTIGAHFVREIEPGEMIVINSEGCHSVYPFPEERVNPKLCIFEFVYFARPDSILYGKEVHGTRRRMGELLAEQAPLAAVENPDDVLVIGVPDSGVPAAEGFAKRSGLPLGQGLVKNRYIGRTFIAPSQTQRANAVRRKLNPLRETISGKRLIVVDDSIVRGTTTRAMVRMLREAGAAEVHLRISSPPFRWPCFFGIDTPDRNELLGAQLSVPEIADYLAVDSLAYLSLENLVQAIDRADAGFCNACLTGEYPIEIPVDFTKEVLEVNVTAAEKVEQETLIND